MSFVVERSTRSSSVTARFRRSPRSSGSPRRRRCAAELSRPGSIEGSRSARRPRSWRRSRRCAGRWPTSSERSRSSRRPPPISRRRPTRDRGDGLVRRRAPHRPRSRLVPSEPDRPRSDHHLNRTARDPGRLSYAGDIPVCSGYEDSGLNSVSNSMPDPNSRSCGIE